MPRGDGIYDEEHPEKGAGKSDAPGTAKKVPEDTPDVDLPDEEPPD